jgi:hypothetical protein
MLPNKFKLVAWLLLLTAIVTGLAACQTTSEPVEVTRVVTETVTEAVEVTPHGGSAWRK